METVTEVNSETPEIQSKVKLYWLCAFLFPLLFGWAWIVAWQSAGIEHWAGTFSGFVLLSALVTASVTDIARHRIPNWLTYTAFLWALMINLVYSIGIRFRNSERPLTFLDSLGGIGIGSSLLGALICFLVLLLIFFVARSGAGDVKLTTVIGTFLGAVPGLSTLIWSYLVAGILILISMIWGIGPLKFFGMLARSIGSWAFPLMVLPPTEAEKKQLQRPFRLGPAFAIGTLITLYSGSLLRGELPW